MIKIHFKTHQIAPYLKQIPGEHAPVPTTPPSLSTQAFYVVAAMKTDIFKLP